MNGLRGDLEPQIAEELVHALLRLARADFSVRLPRTFKKDTGDVLAMFVNVIAEELDRLWTERARTQQELKHGVEQLSEAFHALAAGNFDVRAPRSGRGDVLDVLGLLLDNTSAKIGNAFSEIDRQRAVLQAILDAMIDGVLSLDVEGRVVLANLTAAKLLGRDRPEDLVGLAFEALVAPRGRSTAQPVTDEPFRDRELLFSVGENEVVALSVNSSPVRATDGRLEGIVVVARDNRELKMAHAQLQIADRLATLGTLAAGVAHEINNPLAFVMSNLDFVTETLEAAQGGALDAESYAEVLKALRASQGGAERVRLTVRDLRAFSRVEPEAISRLDLRRLLDAAASMLRNEIRHHAMIVKDYGPVPVVEANEPRLVQVFLNLIQNAAQAIPAGNASANQIRLVTRTGTNGEAVVEVTDTGSGIPSEDLPLIFDLFFTTKPAGIGTGLGLSICQKLVASLGGRIEVQSEQGAGSTFRVVLPHAPASMAAVEDRHPDPLRAAGRMGTRRRLLVVDDEPEIGESLARQLGVAHDVVTVTRGALAFQLLREWSFDLVFCDLMMPEMTGMDLYRKVLTDIPDCANRFVFMTGGVFGSGVEEFLASVPNARIEKPFDRARLIALVEGASSP